MRRIFYLLITGALIAGAQAQTVTQTFALRSGWNSIWLEVEPSNAAIDGVFAGLPVSSVWTYVPKDSPVEFIQQQTEAQFNEPGWLSYLPPSRPDSFLSTLFAVHALHAYLVKLTNAATLTVTGIPVLRPVKWVTDSFNLRGFPVDPAHLPTFDTFFAPSPAHAGQAIYELQPGGQWQQVVPSARMKQGEAYWAYCQGASTFPGPTGIELEIGEGLRYGALLTELMPRVVNHSTANRNVCWREMLNGANNPLSYQIFADNRLRWVNLPSPYCSNLLAGEYVDQRLAIRRSAFTGTNYASIIEITDDLGTRYLVSVTGEKLLAGRSSLAATNEAGYPTAGLWIGSATVTNVNEPNSSQPLRTTPTRSAFDLRLILHVDGSGKVWLLKEVIQMWQNGTSTINAEGFVVTDQPGRYVLLTDEALIPQYRGASLRDGVPVGRRISTLDFDFEGGMVAMSGALAGGSTASGTMVLEPNFPTNPFKHRFHPDHDNLDATYTRFKEEAYRITRNIELRFSATDPAGGDNTSSLEYGHNVFGGVYHEAITGLHRTDIISEGTFRLTRIANSPVLNQ
ncbi:MAG TPA: hypothetical protein VNU68_07685 [Verrucomicrobiae bacterium]|nr:hypothetical protein [Verrucomicrobiae bacterium]